MASWPFLVNLVIYSLETAALRAALGRKDSLLRHFKAATSPSGNSVLQKAQTARKRPTLL